jgi:hypothetical protein
MYELPKAEHNLSVEGNELFFSTVYYSANLSEH